MWRILLACLISILLSLNVSQGLFINPSFEPFTRQKRTTVCVEIKPNVAGSHEPYYMCKGPEFPARPPNLTPPHFVKIDSGNYAPSNAPYENNYQQPPSVQNLHNVNGYQQHQQPPQTHVAPAGTSPYYAPQTGYPPHQMPPQIPFYNPAYMSHPSNHQIANQPTAADNPSTPNNPLKPATSNYEALPQPPPEIPPQQQYLDKTSRSQSLTESTLKTSANGGQENKFSKDLNTMALKESVEPKINSEQFNSLIEEEVLGMPNLGFSHEEMLPFQNLYAEDKMRLAAESPYIPPEYLDDPILRTFYNIDDNSDKHHEQQPYYPPSAQLEQPANEDCFDPYAQLKMPGYMPSAEPTAHMDLFKNPYTDSNNICGCPFSFHPIFIAIPWFSQPYNEPIPHMHPTGHAPPPTYESYTSPPSPQHQARINEDSTSSTEDFSNKKSTNTTEIKSTTTPAPTKTTKTSESSEEDLFVEDSTVKNGNSTAKSTEDDESQEVDDEAKEAVAESSPTSTTTTTKPFTTALPFKTMMHAAKVASSKYYANPLPGAIPDTRKRQVHYITAPVYHPTNHFKRQYVRKLDKMYN